MAIQIIRPDRPSVAELLGTGLGTGLGQGLQMLAQQRLGEMAQRRQMARATQGLQALGIPQQEASQLALLPEKLQSDVIKSYLGGAEAVGLQQALGALGVGPQPQIPTERIEDIAPERMAERPTFQEILREPRLSPKAQLDVAKLQQKQAFQQAKERREAFKETKAERKDIIDKAKADKENMMRIERMETLNETGRLTNPLLYSVLKKTGLDFPVLLTPESQEFKKLTIDFLKDAKKIFGARVTNFEAEKFLESIPSLSQTKEGRRRVIRNLKLLYQGSQAKEQALRQVLRENRGTPPLDLLEKVNQIAEPQIDALASEFKQGIEAQIPDQGVVIGAKFSQLPDIALVPVGTEITNRKTGETFRSDGSSWQRI